MRYMKDHDVVDYLSENRFTSTSYRCLVCNKIFDLIRIDYHVMDVHRYIYIEDLDRPVRWGTRQRILI